MWNSTPVQILPGIDQFTPGLPVIIPIPVGAQNVASQIVIFNGSGLSCSVTTPLTGAWLNPAEEGVFSTDGNTPVVVTGYGTVAGLLFATWYGRNEVIAPKFGGGSLTNVEATVTGEVIVASGVVDINGNVSTSPGAQAFGPFTNTLSTTISMPSGSWTLEIALSPSGGNTGGVVQVAGATTGVSYDDLNIGPGRQESCNVDTALDNSVTLTWSVLQPGSWYVAAAASPRVVRQAHPVNGNSIAKVALLTTGITTIIAQPAFGGVYICGIDLESGANATASPVEFAHATPPTTSIFGCLSVGANSSNTLALPSPQAIGNNGVYVAQRAEVGLAVIVRYAIGVGYP